LIMWETLRAAPEAKFLAKVIPPLAANSTLPTGDTDLESHSVADLETSHLRSDSNHFAGGFVAG
jgi:hypothetical protein